MERFVILPEIMQTSDWDVHTKEAEKILEQYYKDDIVQPQKKAAEIWNAVLNSVHVQDFWESMNRLKTEQLYKSDIHGQAHVERVCLLAAYLAVKRDADKRMFALCMEAAKYHDIGRCNDSEDRMHGCRGAARIRECCGEFTRWECEMIAAVVEAHSLLDEDKGIVFDKYPLLQMQDYEMFRQILYMIKDADALDRFRLTNHSLNIKYLHMRESLSMIQASCEINLIQVRQIVAIVSWSQETVRVMEWLQENMPHVKVRYVFEKDYTLWNKRIYGDLEIISVERGINLYKQHAIHKIIIPCMKKGIVVSSMYLPLRQQGIAEQDLLYAPYKLVYEEHSDSEAALCEFLKRTELPWEQSTDLMCGSIKNWSY